MINITIRKEEGKIKFFEAKGHSEQAGYGQDIVCSAVSVLFETAGLGLEECGYCDFYKQKHGYMKIDIPKFKNEEEANKCNFLLNTIAKALYEISLEYPKNIIYQEDSKPIKKK